MRSFNEAQSAAVEHVDGPMMVLAGPGSGKTTVIVHRVRYLVETAGINPANILVVTFTKAAATEMKARFKQLMGGKHVPVSFGTFHAIFFSILKYAYGYDATNIVDEARRQTILREILDKIQLDIEDESEFMANVAGEISLVKGEMIEPEVYYPTTCSAEVFRQIYEQYNRTLTQYRLLDFDDMMVYTKELFEQRPDILSAWQKKYQYILIDEFQDVNRIQYEIVRLLAAANENLFIVGDDDQSIYHFRGARPEFMLNFEKDYPTAKRVILNINYRSTPAIVAVAERCISHNQKRFPKQMRANKDKGRKVLIKVFKTPREECEAIVSEVMRLNREENVPYSSMAVLFRTNFGSRMMVHQLMSFNLPFRMKDHLPNLYDHWIMKNISAYINVARGSTDRRDYLQIINRPNRYISRQCFQDNTVDFERVKQYYEDKDWMLERLENFEYDLHMLSKLPPYAALNYLRRAMGYENYLYEYAMDRRMRPEDLIEIYENIVESAKPFKSYGAWFDYIDEYTAGLRMKQTKQQEIGADGVVLSTMHSAKGLEYEAVFLIDVNEGITPYHKSVLDEQIEEERRMFYVAMTRAKSYLNIFYVKERYSKEMDPSRFIQELKEKTNRENSKENSEKM